MDALKTTIRSNTRIRRNPLGVFVDASDRSIYVSEEQWSIDGERFDVVAADEAKDFAVVSNADGEEDSKRFSRFDWTVDKDGAFRLCIAISNAKSEDDAADANDANRLDLAKGCNGKPWLLLSEPAIVGSYEDDWGTKHEITGTKWSQSVDGSTPSTFTFLELSNEERYALAQNDQANEYYPGKFSRFDWLVSDDGKLHYCQVAFDAVSLDAAREVDAPDYADLEKGCGGFAWSTLTKN
ncbi:MAG: hypothetical protein QM784_36445 [Polyangiaceae bacterium]